MSSKIEAVVNRVGCAVLFIPAERRPFDGAVLAPPKGLPFDGVAQGPGGDRCFCGSEGGKYGLQVTVQGADGSSISLRPSLRLCDACAAHLQPMTADALLMPESKGQGQQSVGGTDPIGV